MAGSFEETRFYLHRKDLVVTGMPIRKDLERTAKTALPHEMFVHEGQAMVADGAVWFDAHGASAINQP